MVTADEIAEVTIFAALGAAERERLSRAAADIRGALFIFIGADAETAWLPPEIALDRHGYVLTGSDVRAAGRWGLDRDPYLLRRASRASLRAATCGSAR